MYNEDFVLNNLQELICQTKPGIGLDITLKAPLVEQLSSLEIGAKFKVYSLWVFHTNMNWWFSLKFEW